MPDFCYEKCKAIVDVVLNSDTADLCVGSKLDDAVKCLEETRLGICSRSVFVEEHAVECTTDAKIDANNNNNTTANTTARTLEYEESEETMDMLVNETSMALSESRRGLTYYRCPALPGSPPLSIGQFPNPDSYYGVTYCVKAAISKGKTVSKQVHHLWKAKSWNEERKLYSFVLEIGWFPYGTDCKESTRYMTLGNGFTQKYTHKEYCLEQTWAIYIKLEACYDLLWIFGVPPPIMCEVCIGGKVTIEFKPKCPQIKGVNVYGKAWIVFEIGLQCWIVKIVFASLELGVEVGIGWFKIEIKCWWYHSDGWRRRRRWWSRRRRRWRRCYYRKDCDNYVKGWVTLTIAIVRAKIEFLYWTKNKKLTIWLKLYAWAWKWWQVYSTVIYQSYFK